MQARASRGTDDTGNDWLIDFPVDCTLTVDAEPEEESAPNPFKESHELEDAPTPYPKYHDVQHHCEEVDEQSSACLTLLIDDPLANEVRKSLDKHDVEELIIEGAHQQGIANLLDATAFEQFADKLERGALGKSQVSAAVLMHHGTTLRRRFRGQHPYGNRDLAQEDKTHVKTETCLALRILRMISILTVMGASWLVAVPHQNL